MAPHGYLSCVFILASVICHLFYILLHVRFLDVLSVQYIFMFHLLCELCLSQRCLQLAVTNFWSSCHVPRDSAIQRVHRIFTFASSSWVRFDVCTHAHADVYVLLLLFWLKIGRFSCWDLFCTGVYHLTLREFFSTSCHDTFLTPGQKCHHIATSAVSNFGFYILHPF